MRRVLVISARSSATLALARRVMGAARRMLAWGDVGKIGEVNVVVIRTQRCLDDTVSSLGCDVDLRATGGVWLMGASVCQGRVIVMNLTGYLFIRRVGQTITSAMETRPESELSRTWYLIAARNMRALAHEWTDSARLTPDLKGATNDEPAWFREGLAETMSGLSSVRGTGGHVSYLEYHVMNQR